MKKTIFYPIKLDRPGYSVSIIHRSLAERLNKKSLIITFKEKAGTHIPDAKLFLSYKNKYLDALYINFAFLFLLPQIDVVHMVPNIALLPLFLLAKLFGKKIVYTFHETAYETEKRSFLEREILLLFGKWADRTTAISDYCRKSVVDVLHKKPVRIYHGIEKSFVRKRNPAWVRSLFGIRNNNPFVLYVGALRKGKGADVFVHLARSFPKVNFLLIGKGELFNRLKPDIFALKNLFYKPFVEHEQLKVLYSSSEALLFPSVIDAFGLVCVESIACGTPVIALDAGASPEIMTKHTGFLCFDEKDMAGALKKVLSGSFKFSKSEAVQLQKRFNWDNIAGEYLKVYLS